MPAGQHNEIQRSLGRIEGKLGEMNNHLVRINGRLDIHSKSISELKTGQTVLKTKATVFGGIAGVVIVSAWEFIRSQVK